MAILALTCCSRPRPELPVARYASRKDVVKDAAVNVGQAMVAAAEAKGQSFVVDAHQMQYGRMQIIDFGLVLDRLVSEFIGLTVGESSADSSTG